MQLDQTHVVIRARAFHEIGDLAIVMIRRYSSALFFGFFAGAMPWVLMNLGLLAWIPYEELQYGVDDGEAFMELWRYLFWSFTLIITQTPIAGALTTIYLGQAVFEHQPTWRSVFVECRRQFWRLTWSLGIVRLAIPATVLVALRFGEPADGFFDVFLPIVILIWVSAVRGGRPFMPEILLLEQCPLKSKDETAITARVRSRALHSPMGSELSGRFMLSALVLATLTFCFYYTFFWIRGVLQGFWSHDLLALTLFLHGSLWIAAGISVFIRLLSYLDTRIRLEGWEVELAIRAEALRQFGEEASTPAQRPAVKPESKRLAKTSGAASKHPDATAEVTS